MIRAMLRAILSATVAAVIGCAFMTFAPAAVAANGTIQLELYKAGFIVGGSGGRVR